MEAGILDSPSTVRAQIADQTRNAHHALHTHPVLGRLIAPDIRADEYRAILLAYLSFFQGVETARRSFVPLPALSFSSECAALRLDVDKDGALPTVVLPITSPLEALGMIYVMQGSRIGATVIARNLRKALPSHTHMYFGLKFHKANWQVLLGELEKSQYQQAEVSEIANGATKTFFAFDQWMHDIGEFQSDRGSR